MCKKYSSDLVVSKITFKFYLNINLSKYSLFKLNFLLLVIFFQNVKFLVVFYLIHGAWLLLSVGIFVISKTTVSLNFVLKLLKLMRQRDDREKRSLNLISVVLLDFRSISNAARIQLEARIAIHTGEAYAAVLGQSMLTFDLLGADVFHLRRHLRTAAKPG